MKETALDFEPRRDGWFEHEGTWGEVTVGTVIGNKQRRTQAWEVIEQSHGAGQIPFGHTLWMRAKELKTGEEFTIRPREKTVKIIILTRDPADTRTPDPSHPSDSDAIMLLVEQLGATVIAHRDETTGEITCPDLMSMDFGKAEEIEHLRWAHGVVLAPATPLVDVHVTHGQAHSTRHPNVGKGGFPHRHDNEDLTIYTNTRRSL